MRAGVRAEGSGPEAEGHAVLFRPGGCQVQGVGIAVFLGALQIAGFLSLVQADAGQAIGGISAEIDLHVLGVVDPDAVQEDAGVLAAEAADIDGFQSADTAVIPDLDAAERPDGIGDGHGPLQQSCRNGVAGKQFAPALYGGDDGAAQRVRLGFQSGCQAA